MRLNRYVLFCVAGSLLFSGCNNSSPKINQVSGIVTMRGQPLEGATVTFIPDDGPRAIGVTGQSGKYQLSTDIRNDGAVTGVHQVSISKTDPPDVSNLYASRKSLIPVKYNSVQTSGLTAVVKSGRNELNFDIESP